MNKISLYFYTIKQMKLSMIYYRIKKMLGLKCSVGLKPIALQNVHPLQPIPELDFDADFLARFNVAEIMTDRVTLLHRSVDFDWKSDWNLKNETALWNYNLQYFEYLFPLIKAYQDSKNRSYIDKVQQIILSWIEFNPCGQAVSWDPYPISLRLTNWLSLYSYLEKEFDESFRNQLISSIYEQYCYLSNHLEKHLLGNHYLENIKALLLCASFFGDMPMLEKSAQMFAQICNAQILKDGMHEELSPMYHKIVLEDVIRTAVCLQKTKYTNLLDDFVQRMLNVAWSFEEGLDRIPLFNDGGDNVAKSLNSIVSACDCYLSITPSFMSRLVDSGYYIFKKHEWKLIIDAGNIGPKHNPGHGHCDALSFELFRNGKPVISNCGTFAYQCDERNIFRGTSSHNTVMLNNAEHCECWGDFRVAKRSKVNVEACDENGLNAILRDYKGNRVSHSIRIKDDRIIISDNAPGCKLDYFIHFNNGGESDIVMSFDENNIEAIKSKVKYAKEYGTYEMIDAIDLRSNDQLKFEIVFAY